MIGRTPLRPTATWLHQLGFNVNLLGGDKQPIHKWKSERVDYTKAHQTDAQFADLPWNGYTRKRDGAVIPPPAGAAVINGVGDARTLDLDKCTDPALVRLVLTAMDLPDDYAWSWRSGSHKGYGALVRCADDIPESLLSMFSGGILIGTPRDGAAFKQLELRYSGCQTVLPPSLHPSGNRYEWVNGVPCAPPAVVTFDQLLAGFLAIAELPQAKPKPEIQPTVAAITRRYSAEDSASAREYVNAIITQVCLDTDPGAVLERHGAVLVGRRGQMRDYSGLTGDEHGNSITYTVSPARNGKGWIAKSKSPNGKLNKTDYPRGFNGYDALVALDGKTWRDFVPAPAEPTIKAENPYPARSEAVRKAESAERADRHIRAAERQRTTMTERATAYGLPERAQRALDALLHIANGVTTIRPAIARLVRDTGMCERRVIRALGDLEGICIQTEELVSPNGNTYRGGGTQTARRTFLEIPMRGIGAPQSVNEGVTVCDDCACVELCLVSPKIDLDLDLIPDLSFACEAAPATPAPACEPGDLDTWQWCEDTHGADDLNALEVAPAAVTCSPVDEPPVVQPLVDRLYAMDDAAFAAWFASHGKQIATPDGENCQSTETTVNGSQIPDEGGASYDPSADRTATSEAATAKTKRQAELKDLLGDPAELTRRYYRLVNKAKRCVGAQRETLLGMAKEVQHYRDLAYARRDDAAASQAKPPPIRTPTFGPAQAAFATGYD